VITLIYAHPYPSRSRACAALLSGIEDLPGLNVRALYDLYPDFDIDANAERDALTDAQLVVWMHPVYWYTTPALLKHWFEQVLVKGFAYGEGGTRLKDKDCLWVATTGGDGQAYSAIGRHGHEFGAFAPVVEQTARFCGMNWLEPLIVHGSHMIPDETLFEAGKRLRARLESAIERPTV
jgi:glutathione-regulated potassium-efflux system ancillary protein KefF